MFGVVLQLSVWTTLLALPVAAFEMIFAGWLIVKGFNPSATASESAQMDMDNHIMATAKV